MDPVHKHWMYQNWLEDQDEKNELAKNHAYLIASFWNPEAVKSVIDGSDNGSVAKSTDEEFEESFKIVQDFGKEEVSNKRRHRLRV